MKKVSHSLRKVSHSYKKGVALVGMRHLKTAFINILYFCSYCFFNHALLAFLACVGFKDNRDNRDNFFCDVSSLMQNVGTKVVSVVFIGLKKNGGRKN